MSVIWIEYIIMYKQALNSEIWSWQKGLLTYQFCESHDLKNLTEIPTMHLILHFGSHNFSCESHKWRDKKGLRKFSFTFSVLKKSTFKIYLSTLLLSIQHQNLFQVLPIYKIFFKLIGGVQEFFRGHFMVFKNIFILEQQTFTQWIFSQSSKINWFLRINSSCHLLCNSIRDKFLPKQF